MNMITYCFVQSFLFAHACICIARMYSGVFAAGLHNNSSLTDSLKSALEAVQAAKELLCEDLLTTQIALHTGELALQNHKIVDKALFKTKEVQCIKNK